MTEHEELKGEYGALEPPPPDRDADGEPLPTQTTIVMFKAANGELKELRVVQPIEPGQQRLKLEDIRLLAREISKVLKEEG